MSMKNMIPIKWQTRTFVLLFLGFVFFTVIGTLTHECGHYFVARYFGLKGGSVHYGYTKIGTNEERAYFRKLWEQYRVEIKNNKYFPEKQEFEIERKKLSNENFYIEAGGPLETIITGTIGLLLLIIFRRKFMNSTQLNLWQWIAILVTLFWLRGSFNLAYWIGRYLITGNKTMFSDEFYLSRYLGLGPWTLSILSAVAGVLILIYIIFKIIPIHQRFSFMCAGLFGGLSGAVLWLGLVGPRIMP